MNGPFRTSSTTPEPAPRDVPLSLRWRVRFGGTQREIGWGAIAVISFVLWLIAPNVAWTPPSYPDSARGVIVDVTEHSGEDDTTYTVDATFVDEQDRTRTVTSSCDDEPSIGTPVIVDYGPDRACIRGMRDGSIGGWVVILLGGFGVVGAAAILAPGNARRDLRLLRDGATTRGRRISQHQVGDQDSCVYEHEYEFDLPTGGAQRCTVRTMRTLGDVEEIVFDPAWPDHATVNAIAVGGKLAFVLPPLAAILTALAVRGLC